MVLSPKEIRAQRQAVARKHADELRTAAADVDSGLPPTDDWWFEELRKRDDILNLIDDESVQRLTVCYRDKMIQFSGEITGQVRLWC
eukprot:SAG31_NODE_18742_length_624_cov_1.179048_1_plen_87_part_00